jgi:hypothetical protein
VFSYYLTGEAIFRVKNWLPTNLNQTQGWSWHATPLNPGLFSHQPWGGNVYFPFEEKEKQTSEWLCSHQIQGVENLPQWNFMFIRHPSFFFFLNFFYSYDPSFKERKKLWDGLSHLCIWSQIINPQCSSSY